ncbi:unnamed protein product [Calypogeia fissa]
MLFAAARVAAVVSCPAEFHVARSGLCSNSASELEWSCGAAGPSSSVPSVLSSRPRHFLEKVNFESSSSCQCQSRCHQWSVPSSRWRRRKKGRTLACAMVNRSDVVANESIRTTSDSCGLEELAQANNLEEAKWTSADSEKLYRVQGWGSPYFFVSPQGHACVRLFGLPDDGSVEVDLVELIESLKTKNLQLPLVVRFPNLLTHRIKLLQDSFDAAILNNGYKSHFQGVFPVKCNHDRYLVEEVVGFGEQYQFGLEAGSKPELFIAMAKLRKSRSALLICNGYKDIVYMESILLARQLGIKAFVVIEQMAELDLIIKCSRALGVRPLIGIRAKLSTKHNGHWGNTAGDNGKFGLTVNEIVRVVYTLRHEMMLDCLQLLHFHIGSQIPSILTIKEAMREGSHLYCELALMGAPMGYIDVGGGLGIDYDGTKRHSSISTNYNLQDYAEDIVWTLADACQMKGISHPVIVSESGRALASHHSVLIFEVLAGSELSEMTALDDLEKMAKYSESKPGISTDTCLTAPNTRLRKGECLLSSFYDVYQLVNKNNCLKAFTDAKQFKLEAGTLFKLGYLSLEQRAQANALYQAVCHRVLLHVNPLDVPQELQALQTSMAAVYHVNLSLFRSAPDMWAIGQIFPIIPLQRLNEKPTVAATLADLTCDSDGIIDRFVDAKGGITGVLPVHTVRKGDQYYLGLFLAGVYQEALGSPHNLFGTTNTVHVRAKISKLTEPAEVQNGFVCAQDGDTGKDFTIEHVVRGQTTAEVLSSIHHDVDDMMEELRQEVDAAVADGCISLEDAQILISNYESSLGSYTYLTR